MVTVHVEPLQDPLQFAKELPVPGVAVSVTTVPEVKAVLQVLPQLIPVGLLVTVPEPDFATVNTYIGIGVGVGVAVGVGVEVWLGDGLTHGEIYAEFVLFKRSEGQSIDTAL